jgi:hypothetical protein
MIRHHLHESGDARVLLLGLVPEPPLVAPKVRAGKDQDEGVQRDDSAAGDDVGELAI